jgi:hypothetical protein
MLLRPEDGDYKEMPLLFGYKNNSRGLGVADMAKALLTRREHRANGNQLLHVLEILTSFEISSSTKAYYPITSYYERSNPDAGAQPATRRQMCEKFMTVPDTGDVGFNWF